MKMELIEDLYEALDRHVSRNKIAKALDVLFQSVVDRINVEGKFAWRNFGVFTKIEKPECLARNPKTGVKVKLPARATCRFRPSPELKRYLSRCM